MYSMYYYFIKFTLIEFFMTPVYSGIRVRKNSGYPFQSGHLTNTVSGITCNTETNELAYTFIEDSSIVDCHKVQED